MIGNFFFKNSKRIGIIIALIIVILITYFVIQFLSVKPKDIPSDFLIARQKSSLISQNIVSFSDESTQKINEIAQLDKDRKYADALLLVSQELERNQKAREKAVELSVQLEIMAKNLANISPASASQIALEAISSETALISRLINYNDYLTKLLETLRSKFLGKQNGDEVPGLISKINDEAKIINELNAEFNEKMKNFDEKFF